MVLPMAITDTDRAFLSRTVELARQALAAGDEPFGSLLVSPHGEVLFEDHNHVSTGNPLAHPEYAIAQWAVENVPAEQRSECTVYTSGEHCPMCAAAHGWAGLGRIVYASSSVQLTQWRTDFDIRPGSVAPVAIPLVLPYTKVDGPDLELSAEIKELHRQQLGVDA